jgi:hypothetical protein
MGHDYLPNDMYIDGSKDLPIYLFDDSMPEGTKYAGMFGVNPAVNEFAKENLYTVGKTEEWLGTWWFIKK